MARAIAAATASLRGSSVAVISTVSVCALASFSACLARAWALRASRAAITALLSGSSPETILMGSAVSVCLALTRAKAALTASLSALSTCTAAFLWRSSRACLSRSIRNCFASKRNFASAARRSS